MRLRRDTVCLAFSAGGHRAELSRALAGIRLVRAVEVTFRPAAAAGLPPQPVADAHVVRRYHVLHPRRNPLRLAANVVQSLAILVRERPGLVVSSGADVAVATFVLGKLLGARTIFVETCGSLEPTLSGRICHRFSDLFIVQWPEQHAAYPASVLAEGVLI